MQAIKAFFDAATFTLTYVVFDSESRDAVVIDPVWDFDAASGTTTEVSLTTLEGFLASERLTLRMILETHAHADHLSASQCLKERHPGAVLAISERIRLVQTTFRDVFDLGQNFRADGSQFDRLLRDGESVGAGTLTFVVIPTPGHTPACSSYLFGDAVFTGDALFQPDYGTGRCDFPGGSANQLFSSITEGLFSLPDATRTFTGHDYQPGGRPVQWGSTIAEQKAKNIHLAATTSRAEFVSMRQARDQKLAAPKLLYPSVQVNIAAGHLPESNAHGQRFLKIPLNAQAVASTRGKAG